MKKIATNMLDWHLRFLCAPPSWKKEIVDKQKEIDANKENIKPK
jgi:hypothetical protein